MQFSKDYLLILKQYVETSQKGLWNSNTISSPVPLTNFIKIMKSESVTSLSNSPRVAKLIQDIRAIVVAIVIRSLLVKPAAEEAIQQMKNRMDAEEKAALPFRVEAMNIVF